MFRITSDQPTPAALATLTRLLNRGDRQAFQNPLSIAPNVRQYGVMISCGHRSRMACKKLNCPGKLLGWTLDSQRATSFENREVAQAEIVKAFAVFGVCAGNWEMTVEKAA